LNIKGVDSSETKMDADGDAIVLLIPIKKLANKMKKITYPSSMMKMN